MEQYIKKSALVAEIERLKTIYNNDENIHHVARYNILVNILSFLNTLEVKEADLDEEADNLWGALSSDVRNSIYYNDYYKITKHFFELGLKAKQESNDEVKIGETQIYFNDTMKQPYVGNQLLDLSCMKYEVLKALFKDGDNVEILIRKS